MNGTLTSTLPDESTSRSRVLRNALVETARHAGLIAKKDLRDTFRSRAGVVSLVAAPLIMMVLLGYVFPSVGLLEDAPLAVVNLDEEAGDESSPSNVFVGRLAAKNAERGAFTLYRFESEADAREALRSRDVGGILLVPPTFSEDSRHGGLVTTITVLYDQSNPALGRLVAGEAARLVDEIAAEDGRENVRHSTRISSEEAVSAFVRPYVATARAASVAPPSYFQFLAPGLMTMMAVSAVMTGLPASFRKEKDRGTLDTLLVAPVGRWTLIGGKILAQVARGFFQSAVLIVLAVVFFDVAIAGSLALALFALVLTVVSFVGIGVLLTALSADDDGAGFTSMIFLPFLFLSGVIFPVEQLPGPLQVVSKLIPLSYAVAAMRKIMILGAGITDVLPELAILAIFGAVSLAISGPVFVRAFTR